jgi:hypothetical protein
MRPSTMRRVGMTAVASGLLIFSGAGPVISGDENTVGPILLTGIREAGESNGVTLLNTSGRWQTGTVFVEVTFRGARTLLQRRFRVSGHDKVFVSWGPFFQRDKEIKLGVIVDDGVPF